MKKNTKDVVRDLIIPSLIGVLFELVFKKLIDTIPWFWIAAGASVSVIIFVRSILPDFLSSFDGGRQKGIRLLMISSLLVIGLMTWEELLGLQFSEQFIDKDKLQVLIYREKWITYDPLNFNPSTETNSNRSQIEQEIKWIKDAGFTGIITFSSQKSFAIIPEIAKKYELKVIMGIWNPSDDDEVKQAISAKEFVDAYCIGHDGLGSRYPYNKLNYTIKLVRFHTKRPVSTTEKIGQYISNPRLLEIGDWIFPDVHIAVQQKDAAGVIQYSTDTLRDSLETISIAQQIAMMKERNGKPILLKMVTYPFSGVPDASLTEQAGFFIAILEGRRDVIPDIPSDIAISVHSAFDAPWKAAYDGFYMWDPYTGLFDDTGRPRPAVSEITKRLP